MNAIRLSNHITGERAISKTYRVKFIAIFEPDMNKTSRVINFEIERIDRAKCVLEVLHVIIGLLDSHRSRGDGPHLLRQDRTNADVTSNYIFEVDRKVCPATSQVVIEMGLGKGKSG